MALLNFPRFLSIFESLIRKFAIMVFFTISCFQYKDILFRFFAFNLNPYLHVVTWSLPRRYLGLLRIFNFPLEEHPHKFITHSSETLNSYEAQITKKAISQPQKEISAENLSIPNRFNNEELGIDKTVNSSSFRKKTKRKPVISIRVKLDEDLKNLKSRNGKHFDKILSECNKRSCMLVIAKLKSSNQDEYSLNFVNSSRFGKPFKKLLRKNRRRRGSLTISKPAQSLSSEFCEENIHPPLKEKVSKNPYQTFSFESSNLKDETRKTTGCVTANKKLEVNKETNQKGENLKESEENIVNENTQLALPSQLIPYKEPVREEKPLRNWPVITQLFDKHNLEIYKQYLASLSSQDEEEKGEDTKTNDQEDASNVAPDLTEARAFHELLKSPSSVKVGKEVKPVENAGSQDSIKKIISSDFKINAEQQEINSATNKTKVESSNFYIVSEKKSSSNSSQEMYTSTAYLLIGATDGETKNEDESSSSQEKVISNCSKSKSQPHTRLLNSSMRTYESIIKNVDEKSYNNCEAFYDEELPGELLKKNSFERKRRGFVRLLFFNIVLALFIVVVLGVILFISIADNSTVSRFVEKYIKR